jgi:protein PhnA
MVAIEGIDMERNVKDCNGAKLNEGDNVQVIKDLPVKGAGTVLKRGTLIKNIHLTDDDELIEGRCLQVNRGFTRWIRCGVLPL